MIVGAVPGFVPLEIFPKTLPVEERKSVLKREIPVGIFPHDENDSNLPIGAQSLNQRTNEPVFVDEKTAEKLKMKKLTQTEILYRDTVLDEPPIELHDSINALRYVKFYRKIHPPNLEFLRKSLTISFYRQQLKQISPKFWQSMEQLMLEEILGDLASFPAEVLHTFYANQKIKKIRDQRDILTRLAAGILKHEIFL